MSLVGDGPKLDNLPSAVWLIGLGHLGQAYLVRGTEKQVKKGKTPGVRESYSRPTPSDTEQIHFDPRLNLFKTLVPSVKNRVAIRIADGEFLDYLNVGARLRTQRVKVELLVELLVELSLL